MTHHLSIYFDLQKNSEIPEMYKRIFFGVLCAILTINTIRKSHVCDHEARIPDDEKIKLSDVMLQLRIQRP